jgi:peroxiredoxin
MSSRAALTLCPAFLYSLVNPYSGILISTIMALPVGSKAPDFALSTKNAEGIKLVKLSDNFGKKNTLLLFFPMAFTSVCTSELCNVSGEFATYDGLNTTVYGISGDSPFSLDTWAKEAKITVPLLSDYEHSVAKAYDVAYTSFLPSANLPFGGVAKRAAFVIDRNGLIQYSESSDDPKILPNFDGIALKLKELA